MFEKLESLFSNDKSIEFKLNENLGKYSTIKINCIGNLVIIRSIDSLVKFKKYLSDKEIKLSMLGMGANQLLVHFDTLYLKLDLPFDSTEFKKVKETYNLPSSLSLNLLTSHAIKNNLSGWEVFTGIPATLGGAVAMNAGTRFGEIGDLIKNFKVVDKMGEIKEINVSKNSFSYRKCNVLDSSDTIISVSITHNGVQEGISGKIRDYLKARNDSQPLSEKTCGCVFKNPTPSLSAGLLIEASGLKGLDCSGIRISQKHANFFENYNNADFEQFLKLKQIIVAYTSLNFNQEFELEVKI